MKESEETLLKSDVRSNLARSIDLWLKKSEEEDAKKKNSSSDYERNWNFHDSMKYEGMAHAVFMVGKDLGLFSYDDYPDFRPSFEDISSERWGKQK